jgi:hypothetical protein
MARSAQTRSGYKTFLLTHTDFILTNFNNMSMSDSFAKIKEFFLKKEQKIVLIVAFCLISAISYEFGVLQGQKWQQKPLIIEKPANISEEQKSSNLTNSVASGTTQIVTSQAVASSIGSTTNITGCAYVGSKSSTKFYLPTCQWAKSIKPENVVCFKNAEEAIGQGRTESKCTK